MITAWDMSFILMTLGPGDCVSFRYHNELSVFPTQPMVLQYDGHLAIVEAPASPMQDDLFTVVPPPGWSAGEPVETKEHDDAVIISCPMLLG